MGKINLVIKKISVYQFLTVWKRNLWTDLMHYFCSKNFLEYSPIVSTTQISFSHVYKMWIIVTNLVSTKQFLCCISQQHIKNKHYAIDEVECWCIITPVGLYSFLP